MTADERVDVEIPLDRPTPARAYDWLLGGKENYAVDREFMTENLKRFPQVLDSARQNRLFLYRAVRYLVRDAGIDQFIDLGCGLPTNNNVHQVAQQFNPNVKVVYVDIDPIVLAHGRALLAEDDSTAVITADFRDPSVVLEHPDTKRLIDFSRPVAMLFLSVVHFLGDDDEVGKGPRHALRYIIDEVAPSGSYLTLSHLVVTDPVKRQMIREIGSKAGMNVQVRSPEEVDALLDGLEPVEPGLVNIDDWRPDPDQPPLNPVPPELRIYEGMSAKNPEMFEYGGVLRKP
ncbi:SAM-dependent methyltransferase [Thermocrispum agreste]|jgi:SAM-dependent methyltransferase|uniref:SAM-dependent methyltransferase n=1 Tax=Thermocrispum agreste TaxID=37925 RepID=UPI00041DDA54|nr:SAM-dependent methyltransferase [Thermocrispum agreste]